MAAKILLRIAGNIPPFHCLYPDPGTNAETTARAPLSMSNPDKYKVGWIYPIFTETVTGQLASTSATRNPKVVAQHYNNAYSLGKVSRHNVVMASLSKGGCGTTTAAVVLRDMLYSFREVRIGTITRRIEATDACDDPSFSLAKLWVIIAATLMVTVASALTLTANAIATFNDIVIALVP